MQTSEELTIYVPEELDLPEIAPQPTKEPYFRSVPFPRMPDPYPEHSRGYLQMSHMTKAERFPVLFDRVKELQPAAKRVLSFGCSTGEEAVSLANRFPDAEIVGVDIDYESVRHARNKFGSDRIFFHTDLGATGKYDVCTCLMVLFQMDSPIRFEPWDKTLTTIDKHLNSGAVFALYTSEYNFCQSSVAENYQVIRSWTRVHNRNQKDYFCGYYRKK
jgi:2-polyprenyl-3-methyl-5-hydroxy-6-metoxy-1,4-benzoquinol methylase